VPFRAVPRSARAVPCRAVPRSARAVPCRAVPCPPCRTCRAVLWCAVLCGNLWQPAGLCCSCSGSSPIYPPPLLLLCRDLGNNNITGTLPRQWGKLVKIDSL
jgi:hypothetical protein